MTSFKLLPLFSGLLLGLSFPGLPFSDSLGFWWLSPVALVPLFLQFKLKKHASRQKIFLRSPSFFHKKRDFIFFSFWVDVWFMGFIATLIAFRWIRVPMVFYGGLSEAFSFLLFFLYAFLSSFFYVIFFLPFFVSEFFQRERFASFWEVLLVALLSSLLEVLCPRFFSWQLGQLFSGSLEINQIWSFFGVSFSTFLLLFTNYQVAQILYKGKSLLFMKLLRSVACVFLIWLPFWGLGFLRLEFAQDQEGLSILAVQPNYSFQEFFDRKLPFADGMNFFFQKKLFQLTSLGLKKHPETEVILWGESVLPHGEKHLKEVKRLVHDKWRRPLVLQSVFRGEKDWASGSLLLNEVGDIQSHYLKRLAMPFGETLPFENSFPRVAQWIRENIDNLTHLELGQDPILHDFSSRIAFVATICFEVIDWRLIRDFFQISPDRNPAFLVSLLNLVWMGDSAAGKLMEVIHQTRAIEFGRSLVSVANTGPSFLLDAYGASLSERIPSLKEGFFSARLPLFDGQTFFARYGYFWMLFLLLFLILCVLWDRLGMRKRFLLF